MIAMHDNSKHHILWKVGLVFILIGLAYALGVATSQIHYTWNWQKIPQYFIFSGNEFTIAHNDGEVRIEPSAHTGHSDVIVDYDDGTQQTLLLDTETLSVYDGDLISEGDTLGAVHVTRTGILLKGLLTTLEISLYSGLLGLFLGMIFGLFRTSNNPLAYGLSTIYIEVVRGTPLLVQIFIFYFFIGTVLELSRMTAGVWALGIFAGAYVAEMIRAGIQSIDKGQAEAAQALGMNYFQTMAYIILPQALKRILPALAGQFISLIKDSSLVSVIAITDLTKAGREVVASTFASFEVWFTVAALYFALTFSLSQLIRILEKRLSVSD